VRKLIAAEQAKITQLEQKKVAAMVPTTAATNSATVAALELQRKELEKQAKSGTSVSNLTAAYQSKKAEYERSLYGVDLCFILDCSGSMTSWIEVTKEKIVEITEGVKRIPAKNQPYLRVAFVGYRDHDNGNQRIEFYDFFDVNEPGAISRFQSYLSGVRPIGNSDTPEDLAGGMNHALTGIKWSASTKLVVHFGDSPCHGKKYHPYGDNHPKGCSCPDGDAPEKIIEKLVAKGVDYYFGEINSTTSKMCGIFANHMTSCNRGDKFKVLAMSDNVDKFLPEVIKSVSRSMQMSGQFT